MKINFSENIGLKMALTVILALSGTCMATNILADPSSGIQIMDNVNGSQTLIGHVPKLVKQGQAALRFHANHNITAQIIMPLQNQSTLTGLIKSFYDPASPNYHHFLTPDQFSQQFGSSSVNIQSIQSYLNKEGITVVGQSGGGTVLNVSGPVSAFEKALGMHINYYQRNDGLMFFAPDAEPTIPPTLAGKILAVGGLDNLPKYHKHLEHFVANSLPQAIGTGPGGFLAPHDVKIAYNMTGIPSDGLGQTIGLFELQGYSSSDIIAYESHFGLPNVPLQNVIVDGFSGVDYNNGADEVTLDIEIAAAMASGSNINVYEAPNTTQSWIDEWNTIAANTNVKVISCSWGEPELDSPTLNFDNNIFQQMAAQGQAVFVASGDNGAYDAGGSTLGVDEPADQPFVTGVGISKLTTGANGVYSSESASLYGGGGISAVWSIPDYQTTAAAQANAAAKVSTTLRNVPDVALTADPSTGYAFYINGSWGGWWGSSIASPIWAGFMALVDEGLGSNAPIGFVNATLYQLAQSSNYTSDFHIITTGNNSYYPAELGLNDATGLGSFNGLNLYNDLIKNTALKLPKAPFSVEAFPGNAQVNVSGGDFNDEQITYFNVKRSLVSGGPYTTIGTITDLASGLYIDNTVVNGTAYYYVMSAVNAAGESPNSVEFNAKPSLLSPAPSGLNVRVGGPTLLELNWNLGYYTSSLSFNVKRSTVSGGPYTTITTLPESWTGIYYGYWDQTVAPGTTYYYVVSAVTPSGEGPNSNQVSATPSSAPSTESIIVTAGTNGTISPSGTPLIVNYGSSPVFTLMPNTGYMANLKVDGTLVTLTNNTYTLNNITTSSHVLQAYFTPQIETVTATAGTNGTISPTGNVSVNYGANQTFTLTPNANYTASLTVDGSSAALTNNAYTLNNVTTAHTVAASFSPIPAGFPVITSQPVSTTVTAPATAAFSVVATGTPAPSYQWKQSINGGTFTNISGATSSFYTTAATNAANSGTQYEVVVSNTAGSVTSNIVTLTVNAFSPVIVASPSTVNAGGAVTVTVSNGPGSAGDWVGLFPVGAAPNAWVSFDYLNGTHTSPAKGLSSATMTFTAPSTAGQYELRFYLNNSNTLLATSNAVTVNAVTPVIVASPSTVNAGQTVTVTVSNGPGNTGDWVGLFPVGTAPNAWASWGYLNGSHSSPGTGVSSATLAFTAPSTAGQYELRLYLNNSNTLLATSNAVTVNAVMPVIVASPSTVNAGSAVTVTITNGPGNTGDWVGLFPVGTAPNAWISWGYLNGSHSSPATGVSSASLTFTAPSTAGQYELRLYLNNSNTLLATSNAVTVNAVTPVIVASPSTVNAGQTVTVTVSNGPGNTGDWVGLFPVGAAPNAWTSWDYLNGSHSSPATGLSSSTLSFPAPSTGGQYELRLYLNNSNTLLATSNAVTVNAVMPVIVASPSTVNAGSAVTVTITNGPGNTGDWVGLFPVGTAPNAWISWGYLNGSHSSPATGVSSASLTFTAPSTAGQYELRLYLNNSNTLLATSNAVTVNAVTPVIVASPSTVNAGQTVTVTVSNGPGNTGDWVGLFPVGAAPNAWTSWDYLNGSHSSPATGLSSSTLSFPAPSTGGQYELRLYLNNSNTLLATSNAVTVNVVTPVIVASPGTINAGGTITVTVSNGPGNTGDWVGLFPVGAAPNAWTSWDYLNGSHSSPATGVSSTTMTFTAPSTAGQYELRFYLNNSNTLLATSNKVTSS